MHRHSRGSHRGMTAAESSSRAGAWRVPLALCLVVAWAAAGAQVQFEDATNAAGIDYAGESYGASVGYSNADVLPDFFISRHRNPAALLVNQADGTFEDRAYEVDVWASIPTADQHGGAFADFDNDGDNDLLITAGSKNSSQFLVSNGTYLSDRVNAYSFDRQQWGGRMPLWFDFSSDGKLDLAIAVQGQALQMFQQAANDFTRVNFRAEHECDNNDYALLTDMNFDGYHDLVCVTQNLIPENIYDFRSGYPFIDITGVAQNYNFIVDSLVADFDGDLLPEIFALRGRSRISGADITGTNSIEAHLIKTGSFSAVTFQSDGDVTFELHWSDRNIGNVHIGAADVNPPFPGAGEPIVAALSAADPNVQGMPPYDPATTSGIFIGYDAATQTWNMTLAASPGAGAGDADGSYLYAYIDSTTPVGNLNVSGLGGLDGARQPLLLKYDSSLGRYTNQIQGTGLEGAVKCVANVAADFDNDMDQDLYYVCRDAVANLENMLFLNDGSGNFTLAAGAGGAGGPVGFHVGLGENVVTTDYDIDGFVDLLVTNGLKLMPEEPYGDDGPDELFRNLGNGNHWIELDLQGVASNRDGIGAVVTVTAGGTPQMREQNGGYHRWSQNDRRLHFGLRGNNQSTVEIRWPSGQLDTYTGVPSDHLYRAVEGATSLVEVPIPTSVPPSQCAETAGIPEINQGTDTGMFIWQAACSSNTWNVRVTKAASTPQLFNGSVRSSNTITAFNRILMEPTDTLTLDGSGTQLRYGMTVGGAGMDGFDFTVTQGSQVCVGINGNVSTAVVGRNNIPVTLPVDLATLGPCSITDPVVTISDETVLENNPDGNIVFELSLDFGVPEVVTVDYTTVNGLAIAPGDYTTSTGTVQFQPNETTATIVVPIVNDTEIELAETFSVMLSNPVHAVIGDATGVGTIEDDDGGLCGPPVYDKDTERGLFVWQHCTTGEWFVRATAGGTSTVYTGSMEALDAFASVTPFNLETDDVLDFTTDPLVIDFSLNVPGTSQDGFQFRTGPSGTACLDLANPSLPVYLGSNRVPVTPPFDLVTTGTCFPASIDLVTVIDLLTQDPKPQAGSDVSFELNVVNAGAESATNVFLVSQLPSGLTYTGHSTATGAYDPVSGIWSIGVLPASATATLQLSATVNPGQEGNKITVATSAATGYQPDPGTTGDRLSATVVVADRVVPVDNRSGLTLANSSVPGAVAPPIWNRTTIQAVLEALRRYADESSVRLGREPSRQGGAATTTQQVRPLFAEPLAAEPAPAAGRSRKLADAVDRGEAAPTRRIHSEPLSTFGAGDTYTVRWIVGSNPERASWLVGLGTRQNEANWTDVQIGLECDNGALSAWRDGQRVGNGGRLSAGDVLSLKVSGTTLEYQKNGATFASASIAGTRDYRVDASLRSGVAGIDGVALLLP